MIKTTKPLEIVIIYIWVGFVCAISFVEAPLKFQAPGITLPIGLGIGRLVFSSLNKMEWIFAVIIISSILLSNEIKKHPIYLLFIIPLSMLAIQSGWLLPELNERAELIIKGSHLPPSNIHYYYICAEVIKVLSLFSLGITLF